MKSRDGKKSKVIVIQIIERASLQTLAKPASSSDPLSGFRASQKVSVPATIPSAKLKRETMRQGTLDLQYTRFTRLPQCYSLALPRSGKSVADSGILSPGISGNFFWLCAPSLYLHDSEMLMTLGLQ